MQQLQPRRCAAHSRCNQTKTPGTNPVIIRKKRAKTTALDHSRNVRSTPVMHVIPLYPQRCCTPASNPHALQVSNANVSKLAALKTQVPDKTLRFNTQIRW